jgi:hypothetical protein
MAPQKHGLLRVGYVELVHCLVEDISVVVDPLLEGALEAAICKGLVARPSAIIGRRNKGELYQITKRVAKGTQLPFEYFWRCVLTVQAQDP